MATGSFIAAMDVGGVICVSLKVPPVSRSKVLEVVPSMLASQLPFDPASCVWRAGEVQDGRILVHIVQKSAIDATLDRFRAAGVLPKEIVLPAPAAWLMAAKCEPFDASENSRLLVLLPSDPATPTVVCAGTRRGLLYTATFKPASSADAMSRALALARSACAADGQVSTLVAGPSAAKSAAELPPEACAKALPFEQDFLARAVALRKSAKEYGLLHGGSTASADRVALRIAMVAFLLLSAATAGISINVQNKAFVAMRALRSEYDEALEYVAGYKITARGEAALREAREAALKARDFSIVESDKLPPFSRALQSAQTHGIRLSHLGINGEGATVSGFAPSREAVVNFLADLGTIPLKTALDEEPRLESSGEVSFFAHPGESKQ